MARPDPRDLSKRTGRRRRRPRRSILIATNGVRTEKAYLTQLKRLVDHRVLSVTIVPMNGEPETMMRRLRSPNGDTSAYDEVWLVVDEDGADRTGLLTQCASLSKTSRWRTCTQQSTAVCLQAMFWGSPIRFHRHRGPQCLICCNLWGFSAS